MTFSLTKFRCYGIEADEAISKRNKQIAVFNISSANTDTDLDIGDYTGTFWSAVGSSMRGALLSIKQIQTRADSFLGISGSSIAGYVQSNLSESQVHNYVSLPIDGSGSYQDISIPGLLTTDLAISINQLQETIATNNVFSFISNAYAGASATATYVIPGLLISDTILSISPYTKGATNGALVGLQTYSNNSITVSYTSNPGAGTKIVVCVLREGGNPICAYQLAINDYATVLWARDPISASVISLATQRGSSSLTTGTYSLSMDTTNTQLPNILFLSTNAPTSYVLVLQWILKDNNLPVFFEE